MTLSYTCLVGQHNNGISILNEGLQLCLDFRIEELWVGQGLLYWIFGMIRNVLLSYLVIVPSISNMQVKWPGSTFSTHEQTYMQARLFFTSVHLLLHHEKTKKCTISAVHYWLKLLFFWCFQLFRQPIVGKRNDERIILGNDCVKQKNKSNARLIIRFSSFLNKFQVIWMNYEQTQGFKNIRMSNSIKEE